MWSRSQKTAGLDGGRSKRAVMSVSETCGSWYIHLERMMIQSLTALAISSSSGKGILINDDGEPWFNGQ